jgi:hypothetical protein
MAVIRRRLLARSRAGLRVKLGPRSIWTRVSHWACAQACTHLASRIVDSPNVRWTPQAQITEHVLTDGRRLVTESIWSGRDGNGGSVLMTADRKYEGMFALATVRHGLRRALVTEEVGPQTITSRALPISHIHGCRIHPSPDPNSVAMSFQHGAGGSELQTIKGARRVSAPLPVMP